MFRVTGFYVFLHSNKFSKALLNSIAEGIEHRQIQKFTVMEDNHLEQLGLSLLVADDHAIIFRILDCIQQIISRI